MVTYIPNFYVQKEALNNIEPFLSYWSLNCWKERQEIAREKIFCFGKKTNSIREWTCMWSSFELETFRYEPKMSIKTYSNSRQQRLVGNKTSKKEIKGLLTTTCCKSTLMYYQEKTARLVLLFIWSQPCIVCMSSARIIIPSHSMILASLFYKGMSELF